MSRPRLAPDEGPKDKLCRQCLTWFSHLDSRGWCRGCGRDRYQVDHNASPELYKANRLVKNARERARGRYGPDHSMNGRCVELDAGYLTTARVHGWLLESPNCRCCGRPLKMQADFYEGGHVEDSSPTLDRIDPEVGYVEGNVWVICYRCNAIKGRVSPAFAGQLLRSLEQLAAPRPGVVEVGNPGRLLVVGEAPSKGSPLGAPALEGRSGAFLAKLLGFYTSRSMRARVDLVNVLSEWPGGSGNGSRFPVGEAKQVASKMEVKAGHAILLGRAACAFGVPRGYFRPVELPGRGQTVFWRVPHPSGVNRWWNDKGNLELATRFFDSRPWEVRS